MKIKQSEEIILEPKSLLEEAVINRKVIDEPELINLIKQRVRDQNGNITDIDARYKNGRTILHHVTIAGYSEAVSILLTFGANINEKDEFEGSTAFHYAADEGHIELVKLLLDKGSVVDEKNKYGQTALHYAAQHDNKEIIELLLDRGSEVDEKDSSGATAFLIAAECGHKEVVELLLDRGAKIDEKDYDQASALHFAAENGRKEVVELLLDKGARVDEKDCNGSTDLHLAAANGNKEIVELLLDKGAKIDEKDSNGATAFDRARCRRDKSDIIHAVLLANAIYENNYKILSEYYIKKPSEEIKRIEQNMLVRLKSLIKTKSIADHLDIVNGEARLNITNTPLLSQDIIDSINSFIAANKASEKDIVEAIEIHVAFFANKIDEERFPSIMHYSYIETSYKNIEEIEAKIAKGEAHNLPKDIDKIKTTYRSYQSEEGKLYKPYEFFHYMIDPENRKSEKREENILYIMANTPIASNEIIKALDALCENKLFNYRELKLINDFRNIYKNIPKQFIESLIEKDEIINFQQLQLLDKEREIEKLRAKLEEKNQQQNTISTEQPYLFSSKLKREREANNDEDRNNDSKKTKF